MTGFDFLPMPIVRKSNMKVFKVMSMLAYSWPLFCSVRIITPWLRACVRLVAPPYSRICLKSSWGGNNLFLVWQVWSHLGLSGPCFVLKLGLHIGLVWILQRMRQGFEEI